LIILAGLKNHRVLFLAMVHLVLIIGFTVLEFSKVSNEGLVEELALLLNLPNHTILELEKLQQFVLTGRQFEDEIYYFIILKRFRPRLLLWGCLAIIKAQMAQVVAAI